MKAVDTNIVVRVIMQDDETQTEIARRVVGKGVFVSATVLLETGWVLASFYGQRRPAIANALSMLLDHPTMHVADEPATRRAIDLFRGGADLADVIHLAAAGGSTSFVTFDRKLARLKDTPLPIERAA